MNDDERLEDLDKHHYCTLTYRIHVKTDRETGNVVSATIGSVELQNNPAPYIHENSVSYINHMLDYIRTYITIPKELRVK
jgi:hypothetical protein